MSGGHFDYQQYHIENIRESIEKELERQGKVNNKGELYYNGEYHKEKEVYYTYPDIVQEKMREAMKQLKIASIYAHRVDLLLSGDDGEESFVRRLKEELDAI